MYRFATSTALLPTGTHVNMTTPQANPFFAEDLVYLALRSSRTGKITVASGYATEANPTAGHTVGQTFDAHHDQALYDFGLMTVVGIRARGGELLGEVPNRKLALRVFK